MDIKRLALALLAAASVAGAANAKTLKYITFKPQGAGDPQAVTMQWFADEFKKRTGGKDDIKIFWGGSVAKVKEIPDALESGVGDLGDVVVPYFPDKLPINNVIPFFMPQPRNEIELGQKFIEWTRNYKQFDDEMKRYNMKVIAWRPLEKYGLLCTKPIHTAQELVGKRIRTYGFALPQLVKALGATPVSMTTPEAYEALQRGIIDCTPIGVTLARGWRYDEVAKYYIDMTLGASWGHLVAMNRKSYDSLDPQTRAILDGLGKEYLVEYVAVLDKMTQQILAEWKTKTGVKIIPFPKEPIAKAAKSEGVQEVRKEWIKKAAATGLATDDIVEFFEFH